MGGGSPPTASAAGREGGVYKVLLLKLVGGGGGWPSLPTVGQALRLVGWRQQGLPLPSPNAPLPPPSSRT